MTFLRLTGFTQYFLKMPSHSHCTRERCNDAVSIALSAIDWYCVVDSDSGCLSFRHGNGLESMILVGRISSVVEAGVDVSREGVDICTVLIRFSYLRLTLPSVFGVVVAVGIGGVLSGAFAGAGEDAFLLIADALLSRGGRMRLVGVASAMRRKLRDWHRVLDERGRGFSSSCAHYG